MSNLIKVGKDYINLDLVLKIDIDDADCEIGFMFNDDVYIEFCVTADQFTQFMEDLKWKL